MYEFLIILYATIAEARAFVKGKYTTTIYLLGNSIAARFLFLLLSFSYMVLSFVWCFSPSVWIKTPGFILVAMSIATQLFRYENNRLWVRLNAATCVVCLWIVGFIRMRGII